MVEMARGIVEGNMEERDEEMKQESDIKVMKTIIMECYNKEVYEILPLCSITTKLPKGRYSKYILNKVHACIGNAIEIICNNHKSSQRLTLTLKEMQTTQKIKLLSFFKHRSEDFILFFFNPIQLLLPHAFESVAGEEGVKDEVRNERVMKLSEDLKKSNIEFITYLKELANHALELCLVYSKEEDKDNETSFFKNWDKYSGFVLDIDGHFKPILDIINEMAGEIVINNNYPSYSMYRIYIGIFVKFYYKPILNKCGNILLEKIKALNQYVISYHTNKFSHENIRMNFQRERYQSQAACGNDNTYKGLVDCIKSTSDYVTAILEMYVNELNVHYIDLSDFLLRVGNPKFLVDLVKSVEKRFFIDCEFINKECLAKPQKQEIIGELVCQYEKIFPVWFLGKIRKQVEKAKYKICKAQVKELIHNYNPIEEVKGNTLGLLKDSEVLTNFITKLYKKTGKTRNDSEMNSLKNYIIQQEPRLINEIEERELRQEMDKLTETVVIQKNESTCGPLTPETNALYAIEGMPREYQEKIIKN
jgi:hypothetical protein